uniref:Uncharacterized protein n=1 Tax=Arundo donax TaxID=35708 RepID=A0A0A9H8P0_ARUDO
MPRSREHLLQPAGHRAAASTTHHRSAPTSRGRACLRGPLSCPLASSARRTYHGDRLPPRTPAQPATLLLIPTRLRPTPLGHVRMGPWRGCRMSWTTPRSCYWRERGA